MPGRQLSPSLGTLLLSVEFRMLTSIMFSLPFPQQLRSPTLKAVCAQNKKPCNNKKMKAKLFLKEF